MVSIDETHSELRELIKELSFQFKKKDSDGIVTAEQEEKGSPAELPSNGQEVEQHMSSSGIKLSGAMCKDI